MDKFWSICTMPIGLMIGFGPALFVWLKSELGKRNQDNDRE